MVLESFPKTKIALIVGAKRGQKMLTQQGSGAKPAKEKRR